MLYATRVDSQASNSDILCFRNNIMPGTFIFFIILILSASSSSALVIRVGSIDRHLRRYQSVDLNINKQQHLRYRYDPRGKLLPLYFEGKQDDETASSDFVQQSTSQSISYKIQTGNTLELLALAVSIFFLVTVGLARNTLFNSELASKYDYTTNRDGKIRAVYKYVDADAVLQEDFDKYDSRVSFADE